MTTASNAARGGSPARFAYVPGLDGLRGLSVLGPVLFHANASWLPGGFVTIDLFFVLSSFLITSIALTEWDRTGRVDVVAYAGRRARRLLPALFLAVLALSLYVAFAADPDVVPRWRGGIVAALTYCANWFEIFSGVSYFEQFNDPSPLYHTWSLAIEEQFYICIPFVVLGALRIGRVGGTRALVALGVCGAALSAWWMAHLYDGGETARVYYGTDTRAQGLLVGVALAALVRLWGPVRTTAGARVARVLGYAGFAYLVWGVFNLDQNTVWLFDRGGFVVLAVAAAAIVFATTLGTGGPLQWLLEAPPVRYLGRITYGVYLYHWPIFLVLITPRRLASSSWWILAAVALTIAVATISYELIERPIVERRVPLLHRPLRVGFSAASTAVVVGVVAALLTTAHGSQPLTATTGTLPPAPPPPSTTTPPEGTPAVTVPRPLRVLVVGDSVMAQIGHGLERYAQEHPDQLVVFNHARLGCPFVRGGKLRVHDGTTPDVLAHCNLWAEPVAVEQLGDELVYSLRTAVDAFLPDVVLSQATAWDVHDRLIPERGFTEWTHVGDPAFDELAYDEYRAATELLTSRGARMLWMLAAHQDRPLAPMTDPARIDRLNEIVADVAATVPNTSLVDYPSWLADVSSRLDRQLRRDGLHLSDDGIAEVVPWLADDVLGSVVPVRTSS